MEYNVDDWKLVYICTYKGKHYFKIPTGENHFIPVVISACSHIISDISMHEFYNICKETGNVDKYLN
jgi:hypothetical protein